MEDINPVSNKKEKNIKYELKDLADISSNLVSIVTFSSIIYGALLLLSFSASYNIDFIDLISTKLLISIGAISAIIITFIAGMVAFLLYVNKEAGSATRTFYIYLTSQRWVYKNPKKSITILNLMVCLWPLILIKTSSILISIGYPAVVSFVWFIIFNVVSKSHTHRKIPGGHNKRANVLPKTWLCLLPSIEVFIILITTAILSGVFTKEFKEASDNMFFAIMFVIHFISKTPLIPTSRKSRGLIYQTTMLIIVAESIIMLSLPFSDSIVKRTADIVGITAKNKCFLKKDIINIGIPSTYIDKEHSNSEYVKLNIVTKVDDIFYLSNTPDNTVPRKATVRIKGINPIEVECPIINKK
ncbi:Uncharacterised protein [Serratia ficaria]|uniref:hypothetical protein n=1 Tax=Enterobacterales TaxID=91347 RepID=UPI000F7DB94A|nr:MULTISPECIES: hypothetical protein [Enterobacterales]RSV89037.1 hypothetical protein EGH55_20350 [Klebsiella aerogenes]CAI1805231.1 Uncharacterised protein [Serratia ficaria]